ncbi:MAG: ferritin-like domain-containing protein [Chloroflexota bacterium]|nr:ferritin-like domain-containing protein [Chloroflexota bacterium]
MKRSPSAVRPHRSAEQADAFRTLFRQQGDRLWNADRDVDWAAGSEIPDARRAAWLRMMNVFLGLEVMGLDTIQVMMSQATHQVRDPALNLYLAAQCQDEARHVYVLDRYLTEVDGHGYISKPEEFLIERFGGMASWGLYRVENWLTSTLFSENFAALFLQQALELDDVDPLAKQIFRLILRDEVRHVNFLHTILPLLIDRLPAAGRLYVWQSQLLLAGAVALGLRRIKADVAALGIDVDVYKATLIENLGAQFEDAGLDSFLKIDTYARVINAAT